jgi:diadenylate cyclase
VGITEETDALVIVVSEETGGISVVLSGDMLSGLAAPQLRNVLRAVLSGEHRELPAVAEAMEEQDSDAESDSDDNSSSPSDRARMRWGR